jgi:hypothetical protein
MRQERIDPRFRAQALRGFHERAVCRFGKF